MELNVEMVPSEIVVPIAVLLGILAALQTILTIWLFGNLGDRLEQLEVKLTRLEERRLRMVCEETRTPDPVEQI